MQYLNKIIHWKQCFLFKVHSEALGLFARWPTKVQVKKPEARTKWDMHENREGRGDNAQIQKAKIRLSEEEKD